MRIKRFLLIALLLPVSAQAAQPFDQWLKDLRHEAASKGISNKTIDVALTGIEPIPRVIELDRKQPEGRMTFNEYYHKVINQQRIDQGRTMYRKHRAELERAARKYGVPANYIVALWGIETNYGSNTGGFKVVPALATLAHDGRRAEFFRNELMYALKILDQGHISPADMKGSWAGAMGQNQFMPSSFHAFAVDGNNDGRRDIWASLPDVFASTANYLSKSGWKADQRWGREVKIPQDFPESLTGLKVKKSLDEWKTMGITLPSGENLPTAPGIRASLVAPDGLNGRVFLVYDNYHVIMRWNKSTYFATSVGLLANQVAQ
ncbi:MAG TPA: lytic murein transglycosylase [Alphaproteobacteria bacterium]|nr:lytic murein transglycosylase [Alphaproteobacteria bacterium]USO06207.1 MAG: lytic murein transglycosylase [Rhodospirillales bacterium]HOO82294.1 lytic murein transglycosylase [Alphaproteobacteria bacterium]